MPDLVHQNVQGSVYAKIRRRVAATVAMVGAYSGPAEADMKANAPWTDRTSNARSSLNANVSVRTSPQVTTVALTLSHGMEYGIWLELCNNGRYAIVGPTTLVYRAKVRKAIDRIWRGPTL